MSMNWTDAYGEMASPFALAAPVSAVGPYQTTVAPFGSFPGTAASSAPGGKGPALSLVGIVLALVLLRVAIEMGGDA